MDERIRAKRLPDRARNALERMQLEQESAEATRRARLDVLRVKESLVEEGRRRRMLYDEEIGLATLEVG